MFGFNFGSPSEQEIQQAMLMLDKNRQSGTFTDPSAMTPAAQEALKRLLAGKTAGPQFEKPYNSGNAPQPAGGQNYTRDVTQQIAPQQGGVWADAEEEQKKRALAGLPGIK